MKLFIFISLCLIGLSHCDYFTGTVHEEWETWKLLHQKTFSSEEEEVFRKEIFQDNLDFIAEHNKKALKGEASFYMKMNHFGDLLPDEFSKRMNTFKPDQHEITFGSTKFVRNPNLNLSDSIDWRDTAVTPVKNQGSCGSCWAFSTTGALEGQHYRSTGNLPILSEQNLVDCSTENNGCNGGNVIRAYYYIGQNGGIDTDSSYPYEGYQQSCRFSPDNVGATLTAYVPIPTNDEDSLHEAVGTVGPVSIAIDASQRSFQFYSSGVYSDPACDSESINHAVLAVGYGDEDGYEYWLVKNSWSASWGDQGYIKIQRNAGNMCGIARLANYPVV